MSAVHGADRRPEVPLDGALQSRRATAEDADAIAEVLLRSREAFLAYAPSPHGEDEVRAWVRASLLPQDRVTVGCVDERVVAVLATSRRAGASWIDQLYVLPPFVGRGYGTCLLRQALATLPRPVRLYTFQANARARAFYERHGFRAVAFTDGAANEERCPDVLYELA